MANFPLHRIVFILISTAFLVPSALADRDHWRNYDGPPIDFDMNQGPPGAYSICDRYGGPNGNVQEFQACDFGRDEANRMAQRYAGGNGQIEGYLRGYSWGLYKTAREYSQDAYAMAQGKDAVGTLSQDLQPGIAAAQSEALSDASSQANTDAIARFQAVLNTGRAPDPGVRPPDAQYVPMENAYQNYVGPLPSVSDIMNNDLNLGPLPIYANMDPVYFRDREALRPCDIWRADGAYPYDRGQWMDGPRGFQSWMNHPIETRPRYDQLNQNPPKDGKGQPIDLQEIFRSAFQQAYAFYAQYYYAQAFQGSLGMGEFDGERDGAVVGQRQAYYLGLSEGFDQKYKEVTSSSYRDAYVSRYTDEFRGTFVDYSSNPKLSISLEGIEGVTPDGIVNPGELFSAHFTVTNLGGVGTPLSVTASGDVQGASTQSFTIGALSSSHFVANSIAQVDPRLQARETAKIDISVNGLVAELNQRVDQIVEIASDDLHLNIANGSGDVHVVLRNMATIRTPGMISASLMINGSSANVQTAGLMDQGQKTELVLPFTGIDPLVLISGSQGANVSISMQGAGLDHADFSLTPADPVLELAHYFNELANGRGYVPASIKGEDRLGDVSAQLTTKNDQEVQAYAKSGPNIWKDTPDTTIVGKVLNQFRSSSQSNDAAGRYDQLARAMWPSRKHLGGGFLFFGGGKRKAYQNLNQQFAQGGHLK